jgi:hypothetical protein
MSFTPNSFLSKLYTENALKQMGITRPNWKTLIVSASQEVKIGRQVLWETWTKLEDWSNWSNPMHIATRWVGKPEWKVGAQFEVDLNLGFPLNTETSVETVGSIIPGKSINWWKEEEGIKYHYFWLFEDLPTGKTRVTVTAIFHGKAIGFCKPLVAYTWQKMFEATLNGLIKQARTPQLQNNRMIWIYPETRTKVAIS